jgi:hypothetical protein
MKQDNSVLKNNTVFLLRIKYSNEKINYPMQLHGGTMGIFTNLKYAESFLRIKNKTLYNFLADKPFKIYEIEEIALNYFWNFIRTRFYNHAGQFYGEHIWEEDTITFDCRFKKGDLVDFVDGFILRAGIIAGVPPNKYSSPFKDYYLVSHGVKEYGCFHAVSHNVFPLSHTIPDEYKKHLIERLRTEPISKLQQEIESKSDFTTYRIIE